MMKQSCLIGGSALALGLLAWSVSQTSPATVKAADTVLINGGGATFPYPIYSKWFDEYHKLLRYRDQLPVDRIRRRHSPADGGHGRFRRHRRPHDR